MANIDEIISSLLNSDSSVGLASEGTFATSFAEVKLLTGLFLPTIQAANSEQAGTPPPPADDYAASTSTTGTVSVGGSKTGNIEAAGDTDWFKITLVAGQTYRFDTEGSPTGQGTLADTYMRIRDSGGTSLALDDDSGSGLNSQIVFTAS